MYYLYDHSKVCTITPNKTVEFVAEGSNVTLSYTVIHRHYLYFGKAPEFLAHISDRAKQAQMSDVDLNQKRKTKSRGSDHLLYCRIRLLCSEALSDRKHNVTVQKPDCKRNSGVIQTGRNVTLKY